MELWGYWLQPVLLHSFAWATKKEKSWGLCWVLGIFSFVLPIVAGPSLVK